MSSTILRFLFLVSIIFALGLVQARPANVERFIPRQAGSLTSPTTLTTTQIAQTTMGPMNETCTIILTPITDVNGNSAVQEVTSCIVVTGDGSGSAGEIPSQSPTATFSLSTTTSYSSTSTSSTSSAAISTSSDSGSSATQNGPIPVTTLGIPDSGAPAPTSSALPGPTPSPSVTSGGSKAKAATSSPLDTPTPASAAADAATSLAIPGKQLSVLPIGLGVFAGISVIALIIVGLVTYERTKYRKAFRQRKLAEAGTVTGYGGMAERTA